MEKDLASKNRSANVPKICFRVRFPLETETKITSIIASSFARINERRTAGPGRPGSPGLPRGPTGPCCPGAPSDPGCPDCPTAPSGPRSPSAPLSPG